MVTKVDPTGTETLMYSGTWLSSSDYQAANAATDIARENAITAAALATALATIDTLRDQRNTEFNLKTAAITAKNDAINALNNHMSLSHSSGTSGTQGTAGSAGTQGTAGSAGTSGSSVVVVAPSISYTSVSSGPAGTQFGIAGNFPGTISEVKFSSYSTLTSANHS